MISGTIHEPRENFNAIEWQQSIKVISFPTLVSLSDPKSFNTTEKKKRLNQRKLHMHEVQDSFHPLARKTTLLINSFTDILSII